MPKTKADVANEVAKAEKEKKLVPKRKSNGHYWELVWEGGGRLPADLEGGLFTDAEIAEDFARQYLAKRNK